MNSAEDLDVHQVLAGELLDHGLAEDLDVHQVLAGELLEHGLAEHGLAEDLDVHQVLAGELLDHGLGRPRQSQLDADPLRDLAPPLSEARSQSALLLLTAPAHQRSPYPTFATCPHASAGQQI